MELNVYNKIDSGYEIQFLKLIYITVFLQGVTLTDLQEAEKTIGRSRSTKTREEEKEEKEKQDKEKQQEEKKETETKEDDYRSKYRSFEEVNFCAEIL